MPYIAMCMGLLQFGVFVLASILHALRDIPALMHVGVLLSGKEKKKSMPANVSGIPRIDCGVPFTSALILHASMQ